MLNNLLTILKLPDVVCGGADILRTIKFAMSILKVIFIGVPIVLILIIMIDFIKNLIASNVDAMGKNFQVALKRVVICLLLLLVPTVVETTIKILGDLGVDYANCINIALKEDLSEYEFNYPDVENNNSPIGDTSQPSSTTIVGDDPSSTTEGDVTTPSSGDSGTQQQQSETTTQEQTETPKPSTILIGDALIASIRDAIGTSAGGIEWITGDLRSILISETTVNKVAEAAKKDNCKVLIAAYVTSIPNLAGANGVKNRIKKLQTDAKAEKCRFVVASVPPVDKSSGYDNATIDKINERLKTGDYNYCHTNGVIKSKCQKECQSVGTGIKLNLDSCNSDCFIREGKNKGTYFQGSYYKIYYNYLSKCL